MTVTIMKCQENVMHQFLWSVTHNALDYFHLIFSLDNCHLIQMDHLELALMWTR